MLATNHLFLVGATIFVVAASMVWFAPKPPRGMAMGGGH
jgi:DHA2 family multidrug resistance protein